MAQKVQVLFEDDLDGSEASGTIRFGLDGADYEIDLNDTHADQLRNVFAPYVKVSRKITLGGRTTRARRATRGQSGDGVNTTEVREWAKGQGIDVKDRGRVPAELVVKFKAAQTAPVAPVVTPEPAGETETADGDKPTRRRTSRKPKETAPAES